MEQKAILIDYRSQLKDCEESENVHAVLLCARRQWEAVGGTAKVYFDAGGGVAHLVVTDVPANLRILIRETTYQGPEISYIKQEVTPGEVLAMKEELIECISGPDISDIEVEALYEILASKEVSSG